MKKVNRFLLRLFRYKIDTQNIPPEAKKCVLLFAPHTSMLDFVVGKMALNTMGVRTLFLIKKEIFWWPLGPILRKLGGVPVDRKHASKFHIHAANLINGSEKVALLISPEGTRKLTHKWKKGFYYIAREANVPILLGYLDYRSRRGGIGDVFYPTGDVDADMEEIQKYYYGMCGRHKGQFSLENKPYAHPDWL